MASRIIRNSIFFLHTEISIPAHTKNQTFRKSELPFAMLRTKWIWHTVWWVRYSVLDPGKRSSPVRWASIWKIINTSSNHHTIEIQTGCQIRRSIRNDILESHVLSVLVHVPGTGHAIAARVDGRTWATFHHGRTNDLTDPKTSIARRKCTNTRRDWNQIKGRFAGGWIAEISGEYCCDLFERNEYIYGKHFRWTMKEQRYHTHVLQHRVRWHTIMMKTARTTKVTPTIKAKAISSSKQAQRSHTNIQMKNMHSDNTRRRRVKLQQWILMGDKEMICRTWIVVC